MPTYKASPRPILQGIVPARGPGNTFTQVPLPQHLPHVMTLAERGPEYGFISGLTTGQRIFGLDTFNLRGPFTTHQTPYLNNFISRGNLVFLHRMIPANAKKAMLRIALETIPAEIPLWERNPDGTYAYDSNGERIQETNAGNPAFVIGQRIVIHTSLLPYTTQGKAFGAGNTVTNYRPGTTLGTDNTPLSTLLDAGGNPVQSKLTPIGDLEINHYGKYGDRIGAIINAPTALDANPADTAKMAVIKAFLYNLTIVERPKDNTTPIVQRNLDDELSVDFTFKDDTYDPQLDDAALYLPSVVAENYDASNDLSVNPVYAPYGRIHVYRDNIVGLLDLLCIGDVVVNPTTTTAGEEDYDADAFRDVNNVEFTDHPENRDLLNFLTGIDQYGVPYFTFDVLSSVKFGGVAVGANNILYASGGSDGLDINASTGRPDVLKNSLTFDKLVKTQFDNYGNLLNFTDALRFPQSIFYDTGFSINTKLSLANMIGVRKDLSLILATHRFAEYDNPSTPVDNEWKLRGTQTTSEETAIAIALMTRLNLFPESEVLGVKVCRAIIFRQSGDIPNSKYQYRVPLSYHWADATSNYMGRNDGRWRSEGNAGQDDYPNNVVTTLLNINNTSKKEDGYIKDWDNGLSYAQSHDIGRAFIPAVQTVYYDDTSPLNSAITMLGCVEVEKVCYRVWRELTGGSRLTPDEFIAKSNELVVKHTLDRFDGRFTIVPNTRFTAQDEQNRFSWTCDITVYSADMRTVGVFSVISDSLQNLGGQ